MSINKILKAWILTILVGSSIMQLLFFIVSKSTNILFGYGFRIESFFINTFISLIISTILSIPTILIMIVINVKMMNQKVALEELRRKLLIIQSICGGLTFLCLSLLTTFSAVWLLIAISYIPTGLILWKKELKILGTTK